MGAPEEEAAMVEEAAGSSDEETAVAPEEETEPELFDTLKSVASGVENLEIEVRFLMTRHGFTAGAVVTLVWISTLLLALVLLFLIMGYR